MTDAPVPAGPPAASTPTTSSPAAPSTPQSSAPATPPATPPGATSVSKDAAPKTETPAQKAARKYQLKIDGKVSELDLDAVPDDEIVRRWQKAEAASARMQEAAELRKNVERLIGAIKQDPLAALKDPAFGLDIRKMVEDQILQEYEESQLEEPARQAKQLERELKAKEAKIAEYEAKQKEAERVALEERVFQETQRDFVRALEASGLPRTQETIYMMADVARINLENGIELTPEQMASEVKHRMSDMHTHFIKSLEGEALMSYLGDDVITKVLKFAVEKVKADQNQAAFKPPAQPDVDPELEPKKGTAASRAREMLEGKSFWRKF